ncbi:hypothetical protein SAMN02910275_01709 [Butyrivibrio sp. INlla18]|uniref:hypothetical protein n=1 Tax=Butyrivibrio sp. INlla18 TaxID=1520806 RepID=UPI00087E7F4B|nr:hypothetical protein [Butyrivibrio sp. INlla18]SDA62634.1 hypothetical protein SAMN02910275_01709 [Butyrivibrio sp. INlla18]
MITINLDKAEKNAEKLAEKKSSIKVLFSSLKIFLFKKNNVVRKILFISLEGFFAVHIATQYETVICTREILGVIMTIVIALLAVVFTGYALFQALMNDKLLVALLSVEKEENGLIGTNDSFVELMIFQMTCVVIDLFVIIFTHVIPSDWCMFVSNKLNIGISGFLVFLLLHSNIEGIWEVTSFIFNIFQIFNLHAYSRIKEIVENNKTTETKE